MPQAPAQENAVGDLTYRASGSSLFCAPNQSFTAADPALSASNFEPAAKPYMVYNLPPSTPGQAMEYSGSRQWEAKDGVYMVACQDANRNKLAFTSADYVALTDGDFIPPALVGTNVDSHVYDAWYTSTFNPTFVTSHTSGLTSGAWARAQLPGQFLHVPFHTSGVMLTGLSPSSTFTVTVRTMWEVAPVTGDLVLASGTTINPLVPLAKPSAEYDPIALELYQRAVVQLPVGVPVSMNAAGDFWDWCLGALQVAAPAIGVALGGPAGGIAGTAIASGVTKIRSGRNDAADRKIQGKTSGKLDITNYMAGAKPKAKPKTQVQEDTGGLSRAAFDHLRAKIPKRKNESKQAYKARLLHEAYSYQ